MVDRRRGRKKRRRTSEKQNTGACCVCVKKKKKTEKEEGSAEFLRIRRLHNYSAYRRDMVADRKGLWEARGISKESRAGS